MCKATTALSLVGSMLTRRHLTLHLCCTQLGCQCNQGTCWRPAHLELDVGALAALQQRRQLSAQRRLRHLRRDMPHRIVCWWFCRQIKGVYIISSRHCLTCLTSSMSHPPKHAQ